MRILKKEEKEEEKREDIRSIVREEIMAAMSEMEEGVRAIVRDEMRETVSFYVATVSDMLNAFASNLMEIMGELRNLTGGDEKQQKAIDNIKRILDEMKTATGELLNNLSILRTEAANIAGLERRISALMEKLAEVKEMEERAERMWKEMKQQEEDVTKAIVEQVRDKLTKEVLYNFFISGTYTAMLQRIKDDLRREGVIR